MGLSEKRLRFAERYAALGNATQAAIEAGYSQTSSHQIGSQLLRNVDILDEIDRRKREIAEGRLLVQTDIARMWKDAATVDRNDLMEVRRTCCRYCHGVDHQYQETPAERRARWDAHQALLARTPQKEWARIPAFDELGGAKFDRRKDPHPDCPECFGDGDMHLIIKDTRKLPKGARAIYEGVKVTQNGIELKLMDRAKAIENYANHLGMMKREHVLMNPDGTPVDLKPVAVTFVGVSVKSDKG